MPRDLISAGRARVKGSVIAAGFKIKWSSVNCRRISNPIKHARDKAQLIVVLF